MKRCTIRCTLWRLWVIVALLVPAAGRAQTTEDSSLTIIAIGDAGEKGSALRANAETMTAMLTGEHDGGRFNLLLFLGDNFYETGLNVPPDEVEAKIKGVLGPFREIFDGLGRSRVHAVPGNHDYYLKLALEKSLIFGLVNIAALPYGITDRGNRREAEIEWWSYHYGMPSSAVYPVHAASPDSVELLFFDSPVLLRTDPATWRPWLDSLGRLLRASKQRPGIAWRVLCTHNPLESVGEHAGYSLWDEETGTVQYLPGCDKDSNAVDWLRNWLDPQDLCTGRYRSYVDSIRAAIRENGAPVHMVLAGHEHSLQLLWTPEWSADCESWPAVHVISGAGSRASCVKFPQAPRIFTSADTAGVREGKSLTGFVQLKFSPETVRAVFFDGKGAERIDMGGKKEFWIDRRGRLVDSPLQGY